MKALEVCNRSQKPYKTSNFAGILESFYSKCEKQYVFIWENNIDARF